MKLIIALLLISSLGFADETYIKEVENLLTSVTSKDPSRPVLTLRLADGLFDEALNLSNHAPLNEADGKRLLHHRRQAIQLYEESLSGLGGLFSAPTGAQKYKIQFQLARLYSDSGKTSDALKIWNGLATQDISTDIKRESLLRLAESLENEGNSLSYQKAETYYKSAQALCSSQDVCSYSHYRLSWVYHRQDKNEAAIDEMKLALWDSKGQVREEALRDYITFLSAMNTDGHQALTSIEELEAKIKRPSLFTDLSDGFFAAGNKKAGVYVLEYINKRTPTLLGYVKLMEEYYGFRNWAQFNSALAEASGMKVDAAPGAEIERTVKRLTVQLDGERVSQPEHAEEFKKTVLFYLALFPKRTERSQMMDGWLVAETNADKKIQQLKIWIAEEKQASRKKEEIRLRELRASAAKGAQKYSVVVEEMTALLSLAETPAAKDEATYQLAYALYQNQEIDTALPLFKGLAEVKGDKPGPWALKSQHLALDILGKKKAYKDMMEQARTWTANPHFAQWIQSSKEQAGELNDIKNVQTESEFQWAISMGETKEALAIFKKDCEQNILLPKSCENTRVLAINLKDQNALLAVLKKLDKQDELAGELEAAGRFGPAAELREKTLKDKTATNGDYLKVAVLYELGFMNADRDRVLGKLNTQIAKSKSMGPEEGLIFETFKEAGMLTTASLKLPWKPENRARLIDYLEASNHGNAETHKLLVKSCEDTGPAWEKMAMAELQAQDLKQSKIKFYGKNGKHRFEVRLAELKKLVTQGDCYLQSTTPEMRVQISNLLGQSQTTLAEEIKASPIPEGADEVTTQQLKVALDEMALPFTTKAKSFYDLAAEQSAKVDKNPRAVAAPVVPQGIETLKVALEELHNNPYEKESLEKLKSYYETNKKGRLAAYFQGRLQQLQSGGKK